MSKKQPIKIGEKIFFIPHGVGVVDKYEKKEIMGNFKDYMVIRILSNDMLVMLPVDESFPNNKIRKITDKKRLTDVYRILEETDPEIEKNWKARKENNQQLLLSGDLVDFAEIVKTLYEKNRDKPLSYTEKGTIKKVFSFMVNEICIITNSNQKQTVIGLLEKLGSDKEMNEFLRTNL